MRQHLNVYFFFQLDTEQKSFLRSAFLHNNINLYLSHESKSNKIIGSLYGKLSTAHVKRSALGENVI